MYQVEPSRDRLRDPSLRHYLETIGRYKLLTRDEEFALGRRSRQGDREALDRLVNANLRFVVSVAKTFLNHGLSYMDLIAEGNVGLITAARKFDERRGFRFISYAVWWIRQAIQRALAEQTHTVRLPIHRTQQAQKIRRVAQKLEQTHGRKVNEEEIAAMLSLSPTTTHEIRAAYLPLVSIDEPLYDGDLTLADTLTDDTVAAERGYVEDEFQAAMSVALRALSRRERDVVVRYYGLGSEEPASLETIGRDWNLSRERIRQIRNAALAKLRCRFSRQQLNDYLS